MTRRGPHCFIKRHARSLTYLGYHDFPFSLVTIVMIMLLLGIDTLLPPSTRPLARALVYINPLLSTPFYSLHYIFSLDATKNVFLTSKKFMPRQFMTQARTTSLKGKAYAVRCATCSQRQDWLKTGLQMLCYKSAYSLELVAFLIL